MTIKLNQEQREAIGRAVLEILGTTPEEQRVYPGGIVGLHTSSDVLTLTIVVPCSWLRRRGGKPPGRPLDGVKKKAPEGGSS